MPPDLQSLCTLRSKNALFAKAAGPLYAIAVLGKEEPWHSVVSAGWSAFDAARTESDGVIADCLKR